MKILSVTGVMVSVALFSASAAYAQQDSRSTSVGDVARAQRELRKQRLKKSPSAVVHTDDEIAATNTAEKKEPLTTAPADSAPKPQPVDAEKSPVTEQPHSPSVLDRPKDSVSDTIVVPAGTQLRVDIHDHKIVVPVRVGFVTPIPALSQVTVQLNRTYLTTTYSPTGTPYADYIEYATVTAVTVSGKTYEVQTDSVPLLKDGTNSELTFILGNPVALLR
jgi:hypothetical protein